MSTDDNKSIELKTMIEHFNQQTSLLYTLMNAVAFLISKQRSEPADVIYEDLKTINHSIYTTLSKVYPSSLVRLPGAGSSDEGGHFPFSAGEFPPYAMN